MMKEVTQKDADGNREEATSAGRGNVNHGEARDIIMPRTDEEQEDENHPWYKRLVPSRAVIVLILCLALNQAIHVVNEVLKDEFKETAIFLLHRSLAFSIFGFWIALLDLFHNWIHRFADRRERIETESKTSKQERNIMRSFCRFGDMATDRAYATPGGSRSPARVLAEVAGVYCNLGKGIGFAMLLFYMVGINLYSNLIIFGGTVFVAAVLQALHINDALGNLIPLAFSNSVHLGEIVSLSRPGGAPADYPQQALCGFVEAITWNHVVIRDFQRKQVFVPHREMKTTVLHNWSRRPSKLCLFELTVVPSLGGETYRLVELSRFTKSWVERHPKIDQSQYTKTAIHFGPGNKPLLKVQFYPKVGEKSRALKAEFTVMIMDVSKRLDLCIIPVDISPLVPWQQDDGHSSHVAENTESTLETEDEEPFDFSDLLLSKDLTYRTGIGPKKSKGPIEED
jgi:small-conductance mechanosensitive channel